MKRIKIFFAIGLLILVSGASLLYIKYQTVALDTPLPNPNGYDQFVKAADLLQGDASGFAAMSEPELTGLIATNTEALALVHSAFRSECRVPIHSPSVNLRNHAFVQTGIQNLAMFLAAKGRLTELDNHPAEAAKDYLEVIRFGMEAGRGGLMLDAMMGIKVEGLAHLPLERLLNQLDASSCRATATALEALDLNRQDFDDVFYREMTFHHEPFPSLRDFFSSFRSWIAHFAAMRRTATELRKSTWEQFRDKQYESRVLAIKFAGRAYELDKGRPPLNIQNLVPTYLDSIPRNPDTGKEMVYPPR